MTKLLAHGTVVLDGGLSNALEDRGHDLSSDLWTARLLRDDPGEIVAVHRAYFAAGGPTEAATNRGASVCAAASSRASRASRTLAAISPSASLGDSPAATSPGTLAW
jgi:homocysteine S-methyltransferase